jgi:hypothetical protein
MLRVSVSRFVLSLLLLVVVVSAQSEPGLENLAYDKPAIQSSTYVLGDGFLMSASLAVDGNRNANSVAGRSCSHTQNVAPEWWAVDLEQETSVGRVRITNRDDCCTSRLQQFFIGVTNRSPWNSPPNLSNLSQICAYYYGFPAGGIPIDISCEAGQVDGRYLFIMMRHAEYLTLCEVEVFDF